MKTKIFIFCSIVTIAVLFSTAYESYARKTNRIYESWSIKSNKSNPSLPLKIAKFDVVVTIYHPVKSQTDSTPDIVASGKKINIKKAGDYRYVAVSRDLLSRWGGPLRYGDVVYIGNAGELSGYYIVEDTMNRRYTKRVDILRSPGAPLAKFNDATLYMRIP